MGKMITTRSFIFDCTGSTLDEECKAWRSRRREHDRGDQRHCNSVVKSCDKRKKHWRSLPSSSQEDYNLKATTSMTLGSSSHSPPWSSDSVRRLLPTHHVGKKLVFIHTVNSRLKKIVVYRRYLLADTSAKYKKTVSKSAAEMVRGMKAHMKAHTLKDFQNISTIG